jgi:histidinol-phosphate aminotransferase
MKIQDFICLPRKLRKLTDFYELYEVPDSKFIDLCTPIVKYPLPSNVLQALQKAARKINYYPNFSFNMPRALLEKISQKLEVHVENILLTNGLNEAIDLITRTFVGEGEKALIPVPTFWQFEIATLRQGATPIRINLLKDDEYDFDKDIIISTAMREKVKLVWICNPNNPTGVHVEEDKIIKVVKSLKSLVVVDESYSEICGKSIVSFVPRFKNLIVLRGFSKTYGLAGLRIGYVVAHPSIIRALIRMKIPFNVNIMAQVAALAALENENYYKKIWKKIREEREKLKEKLRNMGLKVFDSETNFILLKTPKAKCISKELRKRKIYVMEPWKGAITGLGNEFLRITVGLPKENEYLIRCLKRALKLCS